MIHESARHRLSLALACVLGVGLAACGDAESREAPEGETIVTAAPTVPAGTSMTFTLDEAISPEEHEKGDEVTGTLTADVAGLEGGAVLETGAKARWTVVEVIGGDDDEEEQAAASLVVLRLDAVQLDDEWHPVNGTVTNVEPPEGATPQDGAEVAFGSEAEALMERVRAGVSAGAERVEERTDTILTEFDTATGEPALQESGDALIAVSSDQGVVEMAAGSRVTVRLNDRLVLSEGQY